MLRGYRGIVAKVAGLAILAALAFLGLRQLQSYSDDLEQYAAYRSDIHRQNAEYRIKRVCPPALSQDDCVEQTRNAKRENQRAEQDLAAQKVTAWWTQVMGIAALIGMGLSAVGVWLVKTTFDETRQANEIARSVVVNDTRPIMAFKEMRIISQMNGTFHMCGEWENIGKGPAQIISFETGIIKSEFGDTFDVDIAFAAFQPSVVDCEGLIVGHQNPMGQSRHITVWRQDFKKRVRVMLRIKYRSALGDSKDVYTTEIVRNIFPIIELPMRKAWSESIRNGEFSNFMHPADLAKSEAVMSDGVPIDDKPITDETIIGVQDITAKNGVRMK